MLGPGDAAQGDTSPLDLFVGAGFYPALGEASLRPSAVLQNPHETWAGQSPAPTNNPSGKCRKRRAGAGQSPAFHLHLQACWTASKRACNAYSRAPYIGGITGTGGEHGGRP
jgi:hypothetical protein